MKNVFLYVRVSSAEQAKEGYSIGEQKLRLEKYCESFGWTVKKVFTDAGFSGATMNRPALQDMISDVKKGLADCVIVWKLDRLSRSQKDTLILIDDIFLANGTDFISMTENFDTSTPFGRAMIGILAVFAQLEREKIKERTALGREARAREGKWSGGITPLGYDYQEGNLTINEDAMKVKSIFEAYLAGQSLRKIAESVGIISNRTKSIRYILSNKTYIGYIRHKGEWIQGNHQPIIDEEAFNQAQIRLKMESEKVKHERRTPSTMLGGIIYCGCCGARYGMSLSGSANKHKVYTCYSRNKKAQHMIRSDSCKNKIWKVEELDKLILSEVNKLSFEPLPSPEHKIDTKCIESQIASIDKQISRFLDLYGLGKFSVSALEAKIVPLEEKKHLLNLQLEEPVDFSTIIESIPEILEHGDFEEVRFIVHSLIDRIIINGEDVEIHWNFD